MIKTLLKTSLAATAISVVGLLAQALPSQAAAIEPPIGNFYGLDLRDLVSPGTVGSSLLPTGPRPYFGDYAGLNSQNQLGTFDIIFTGQFGGESSKPLGGANGELNLGAIATGSGPNTFQKVRIVFTPSGPWAALPILRISNPMSIDGNPTTPPEFTFNNFAGNDDNWMASLNGGSATNNWVVNNPMVVTNVVPNRPDIQPKGAIALSDCLANPRGTTLPPVNPACGGAIPSTNIPAMTNLLANGSTWSYPFGSNQTRSLLTTWSLTSSWQTSSIDLMFFNDNPLIPNANTIKIATAIPEPKIATAIPEPLTMLGAGTAVGFGAFFKRRLAQAKSKKADQN